MKMQAEVAGWRIDDEINAEIANYLGWTVERTGDIWRAWPPKVKPNNKNWVQLKDYQNSLRELSKIWKHVNPGPMAVYVRDGRYQMEFTHEGLDLVTPPQVTPAWAVAYALLFVIRT